MNFNCILLVPVPDLQIRGRGGLPKKSSALQASVWSKNKGGAGPGPLAWIRHWLLTVLLVEYLNVYLFYYLARQETEDKLAEINNARNESVDALKSHREELALLRRKIQESMSKMKECEKLRLQKEAEYEKAIKAMNEGKDNLEKELKRLER